QRIYPDRGGMMDFERNHARWQAFPAPRELRDQRAALARIVQEQAGVLAARLGVDGKHPLQPRAEVRHARLGFAQLARGVGGGGCAVCISGCAEKSSTMSKRSLRSRSARSKSIARIAPQAFTHSRCALHLSMSIW